jgi:hypothetical protein
MSETVFFQAEFWALVFFSLLLPVAFYVGLLLKRAISRGTVLLLGVIFVIIAGIDVFLLQRMVTLAKLTPSVADDAVFLSEATLALYLLPALFGSIGFNILSHILVRHLDEAQRQHQLDAAVRRRREHPGDGAVQHIRRAN